jgi:hypothetical protein
MAEFFFQNVDEEARPARILRRLLASPAGRGALSDAQEQFTELS